MLKKLSKNQFGFSAVESLLLIILAAIIGFIGWYVWHARQSSNLEVIKTSTSQSTNGSSSKPVKCNDTFKELKSEKIGIFFCYPKDWTTDVMDTPSNHIVGTVNLTSPDYKEEQIGYGGSKTGTQVFISVYNIEKLGTAYTSVKDILAGTATGKSILTNIKAVKIAGHDGVAYISAYEGPRFLYNQFEYKGNQYEIVLQEDIDGPKFNDNQDLYQKIVDTFEVLK